MQRHNFLDQPGADSWPENCVVPDRRSGQGPSCCWVIQQHLFLAKWSEILGYWTDQLQVILSDIISVLCLQSNCWFYFTKAHGPGRERPGKMCRRGCPGMWVYCICLGPSKYTGQTGQKSSQLAFTSIPRWRPHSCTGLSDCLLVCASVCLPACGKVCLPAYLPLFTA